jgi:prophage antirepressor-like protein
MLADRQKEMSLWGNRENTDIPEVIMTEALAQLFENHVIHVIERDGEPWFALSDLATVWGTDRKTPGNIIDRNQKLFAGMYHSDGDVTYHDVNERGLYVLMGKISADRLKNPEARTNIIRFQRWVPELIQRYRKKEIVQVSSNGPDLHTELERAKMLALETGGNLPAFQKIALEKCGMGDCVPALKVPATPAIVHGQASTWFNASQLAEMCRIDRAEYVNNYLHNHGWIYRDASAGRVWRLQPIATDHGREYWFEAPSGHREIPDDQMALPARVMASRSGE